MQLAIARNGFAVETAEAADGREAMCLLRRVGPPWVGTARPDLILLDIKMPGQGGLVFLAAVKQDETLRAIPVVVVTTSLLEAAVRRAYQLGAAGDVQKPAGLPEFMATVRILGDYWLKLVCLAQNGE